MSAKEFIKVVALPAGHLLDLDGLGLEVFVDTLETTFATVAGLLEAAKWCVWSWEVPVVHSNGAGFDQLRDTQSTRNGFSVHASLHASALRTRLSQAEGRLLTAESKDCIVGHIDGLVLGLECLDSNDWTKHLFLDDPAG
jgi:hypothetical protein